MAALAILHFYMAFLPNKESSRSSAYWMYILMGVSYGFFGATSWPMIPFAVDRRMLGTAYGIGFGFQSIGIVFGPLLVGKIADANRAGGRVDYFWVSIFLGGAAVLGLAFILALIFIDLASGGVLIARNSAERYAYMQNRGRQKMLEERDRVLA